MTNKKVRTRFAPSPTGFMHVGNLRTALYEYLIAKSQKGKFVLRIEDTDRERFVDGAIDKIYNTLKAVGIKHDEGPDIGGEFGPYVQSKRRNIYMPYALKLIKDDKAYYCFCSKERLESLRTDENKADEAVFGYDRHCRNLPKNEVKNRLKSGAPYVIRQKMPLKGSTTFKDTVFGEITVENTELQDQILIKADGYPTYNFANVIDDHLMNITHVVRGSEYLSSTPKYTLLYEAFGWESPVYIHLPLIMGKNDDGNISKLSKRHGATCFEDLVQNGYLSEAIVNYIALLGWCPKNNQEVFSLKELCDAFSVDGISKSPAVFDYDKLKWFNAEYIKGKSLQKFTAICMPYFKKIIKSKELNWEKLAQVLQPRTVVLTEILDMIDFFEELPKYENELFINKKSKTDIEKSIMVLKEVIPVLQNISAWESDIIKENLMDLAKKLEIKNGTVMYPVRIAVSGKAITPGGAVEILDILGKDESLKRLDVALKKLNS